MEIRTGEFDPYEKEFIKNTYLFFTDTELGKILNRTPYTIEIFRRRNGLQKKDNTESICKKIPIIFLNEIENFELDLIKLKEIM